MRKSSSEVRPDTDRVVIPFRLPAYRGVVTDCSPFSADHTPRLPPGPATQGCLCRRYPTWAASIGGRRSAGGTTRRIEEDPSFLTLRSTPPPGAGQGRGAAPPRSSPLPRPAENTRPDPAPETAVWCLSRGPLDPKRVAFQRLWPHVRLHGPGRDLLATRLLHGAEVRVRAPIRRRRDARFFFELPPRSVERSLAVLNQALRDRPGPFVLVPPVRPAEVAEKDLRFWGSAVEEKAGAVVHDDSTMAGGPKIERQDFFVSNLTV